MRALQKNTVHSCDSQDAETSESVLKSYHVWSADGRLIAFWDKKKEISSVPPSDVRLHLVLRCANDYVSRRTYRLWRVHVWITPREMGSVCGQHDFIDLVGLNNAIFWGCKKSLCHCVLWRHEQVQTPGGNILHNLAADANRNAYKKRNNIQTRTERIQGY